LHHRPEEEGGALEVQPLAAVAEPRGNPAGAVGREDHHGPRRQILERVQPDVAGSLRHGVRLVDHQHLPAGAEEWPAVQRLHDPPHRVAGLLAAGDLVEAAEGALRDGHAERLGEQQGGRGLARARVALEEEGTGRRVGDEQGQLLDGPLLAKQVG
jgi:hypothetical protein